MPKFFSKAGVSVEFRVVRAYLTSREVQQETGIIANFSAKTVLINGKVESELMGHNSLMLTVNRQGHLFVSSKYEQPEIRQGSATVTGPRVFYFSLMPGSDRSEASLENYDKFVTELADDIEKFVIQAQETKAKRESMPREMPSSVKSLIDMSPQRPKPSADKDDSPF